MAARVLRPGGVLIADIASSLRRRWLHKTHEGWHGATALTGGEFTAAALAQGLRPKAACGIMFLPVHRLPPFARAPIGAADSALAAAKINGLILPPGAVFSFWAVIGRPSHARGFQMGRAIRADRLSGDIGGGLCQISGLIYELGLRAGLTVLERHPHSQDLYSEETRFTPLGLDATIVWGRKDLRLANPFDAPVIFAAALSETELSGALHTRQATPCALRIARDDAPDGRSSRVRVYRRAAETWTLVSEDVYRRAG